MITESGAHASLHPNPHHQIIFVQFNLEIYYPLPYFCDVWRYQDAYTDLIRHAIAMFDWDRVHSKKTIFNILSNFIPHETLSIDDKDTFWFRKKKSSKRKTMFMKAIETVKTYTIHIT